MVTGGGIFAGGGIFPHLSCTVESHERGRKAFARCRHLSRPSSCPCRATAAPATEVHCGAWAEEEEGGARVFPIAGEGGRKAAPV